MYFFFGIRNKAFLTKFRSNGLLYGTHKTKSPVRGTLHDEGAEAETKNDNRVIQKAHAALDTGSCVV